MNGQGIQAGNNNIAPGSGTTLTAGKKKYAVTVIGDTVINHASNMEPDMVEILSADLTNLIATANGIKLKYNDHCKDNNEHANADAVNVVTAPDANDWTSLGVLLLDIYNKYSAHMADSQLPAAWLYHKAQGSNIGLVPVVLPYTDIADIQTNLSDMLLMIQLHDSDAVAHNPAGLHPFVLVDCTFAYGNSGYSWFVDVTDPLNQIKISTIVIEYIKASFYFNN